MGLKKSKLKVDKLGITISKAYAQIDRVNIDLDGNCFASFKIQTSRETMNNPAIDIIHTQLKIDKDLPLYKQIYEHAKLNEFKNWTDDIVEETDEIIEETIEE